MDALLELEESVSLPVASVPKPRDYSHLKAYQFKAGALNPAQTDPRAHRQRGTLNAATILERSTPRIAKHYVKRSLQSDPVLIDAMKRILPVADEAGQRSPAVVIIMSDTFQRAFLTVPADGSGLLSASETQPVQPPLVVLPPVIA